jgi:hypothetical protein
MQTPNDNLEAAADGLERALAEEVGGREQAWAGNVDGALAAVEEAVREHAAALEGPDGRLVEVDRDLLPSPTVTRRAAHLRQELDGFLKEAQALRSKVPGAVQTSGVSANPQNLAGALEVAPEAGAAPDRGVFHQRARRLLEGLRRYPKEEGEVILDGITPDIGAGD